VAAYQRRGKGPGAEGESARREEAAMIREWWNDYKVDLPEGRVGDWAIERFEITPDAAKLENLRLTFSGAGYRMLQPGICTRLMHRSVLIMSDTRAEIRDHLEIIRRAKGQVLLNGLGLGMVLRACLLNQLVQHITVIEIAPEVIALVVPRLREQFGEKFTAHEGDAFTWTPPRGTRYNVVWHDVWNDLCEDNLPEMHKLHRRYGCRCDWQGSWGRDELKYRRERMR